MRFHRGPIKVKQLLNDEVIGRPVSAHLWVSSYLPSWHPTEDYREMYSAKKELGGGVVMDSIHEIDLTHWLFGKPDVCAAFFVRKLELWTLKLKILQVCYSNTTTPW